MSYQHKGLAAGRWNQFSLAEKLANIGSEVERALSWKLRHNDAYCQKAVDRALELMDLTLGSVTGFSRLRELARLREVLVDYFFGANQFGSTETLLRKYFSYFNYVARKNS